MYQSKQTKHSHIFRWACFGINIIEAEVLEQ